MNDESSEKIQGGTSETAAKPMSKSTSSWLGRTVWAGEIVAEARATGFTAGRPGFSWFDMARQLCDDVVKIGDSGKSSWAVLVLEATAAELLVRAYLERVGLVSSVAPLGEADWDTARSIAGVEAACSKLSPANLAMLVGLTGPERDAALARLTEEERESFAPALHELVMRLMEPLEIDANRLGRALFSRWSRVVVVLIVAVVGAGVLAKWLSKKLNGPNIALHSAVTTSSQYPGQGLDHTLLVDGDSETMGFHTQDGGQQWVVIDLGAVRKFNKIVVYNRADGFEERAVPLKIEVSNDNQSYKQIAERKEVFSKWTAKNLNAEGRYVRLENTPPNFFHLGEVEIYR